METAKVQIQTDPPKLGLERSYEGWKLRRHFL